MGLLLVLLLTAQLVFSGMFGSLQHWCPLNWPHPRLSPLAVPSITLLLLVFPPHCDVSGSELGALLCWMCWALLVAGGGCAVGIQSLFPWPATRLPGSMMAVVCVGALCREQGRIFCERS